MNYKSAISKFDIVDKKGNTVPFVLNREQESFLENMSGRDVILKSRQIGFSSLILAVFTVDFCLKQNSRSVVISHDSESAQRLLDRVKFFLESAQRKGLKLNFKYNSRNELVNNEINSSFYIGQAGSKSFGRGDTLTNLHLSEFAFYPDSERMLGSVLQAVVPDGKVIIETTANGINFFKSFWDKSKSGETGFKTHFFNNNFYDEGFLTQKKMELGDHLFRQEYPRNDAEAFIHSGTPFFDMEQLDLTLKHCREPQSIGNFIGMYPPVFEKSSTGLWSLWELPKDGHDYILSADVAEKTDYSAAIMLDRNSFRVVATFNSRLEAALFANELFSAGKYYNNALLAPEKNNQGLAVLQKLRDLYYPKLYTRVVVDSITKEEANDFGWITSSKTRPLMLSNLQTVIKQNLLTIWDKETVLQMMAFARNDKGKPEAVLGSHDDRVIALAIAVAVHEQVPISQEAFDMLEWERMQYEEQEKFKNFY